MIILATQKNMMSCPVIRVLDGRKRLRSSDESGHPIVAKGQRADENQVSSTSSSFVKATEGSKEYFARACCSSFATKILPAES